jgi:hypothetical protein
MAWVSHNKSSILTSCWKVYKKSVLFIDGKNKNWSRRKCNIKRRSEQYAEIKAQKRQHFALSRSATEVQEKDSSEEESTEEKYISDPLDLSIEHQQSLDPEINAQRLSLWTSVGERTCQSPKVSRDCPSSRLTGGT